MKIILVGLNFLTTPVALREKLAFQTDRQSTALKTLLKADGILEAVILSTCNRVELYVVAENECGADLITEFLSRFHDIPTSAFAAHLYTLLDRKAVEHLFLVATSAKSMVLGETQIQAQIKAAFETSKSEQTVGPVLSALFQHALRVGKRARSETSIGEHSLSVSHAAVSHIHGQLGALTKKKIVVVGLGKMSQLTILALKKYGGKDITVVNRNQERALAFVEKEAIQTKGFDALSECLETADVVISSTAARQSVITKEMMISVAAARQGKPLLLYDIAVPRDIDSEVGSLPGITLLNIDQLQAAIDLNKGKRAAELAKVSDIVATELTEFEAWQESRALKPVILDLRQQAETIRENELRRAMGKLDGQISPNDSAILAELTTRIVNKLLHKPIVHLREQALGGNVSNHVVQVRKIFGLESA